MAWVVILMVGTAMAQNSTKESGGESVMYEHGDVVVTTEDGQNSYDYRLMRPDERAGEGPHPLLVFLHGAGERGSDNEKNLTYLPRWMASKGHRRKHACYLLAVQCPEDEAWAPYDEKDKWALASGELTNAMKAVLVAIEEVVARENVDHARIYLTGLSMGGFGSWSLAAHQPERFAAVVPICGGGDVAAAERIKGVPIWAFHGLEDRAVPEAQSRQMIEAIRAAGGVARYSALEGVHHDSWTHAYKEAGAIEWMFEQRLEPPAKPDAVAN